MARFRIFGLPMIWAVLIGVVIFILWKPIVSLFTGLYKKVKPPTEETGAGPVPPVVDQDEITTN